MLRVGDKLMCKVVPPWGDFQMGKYYTIYRIQGMDIIILCQQLQGHFAHFFFNDIDYNSNTYIYKYFLTIKEQRILKLKQLEHESR